MPIPSLRVLLPTLSTVVATPALWLIKAYQLVISPMRPPTCRFYPSCSAYAVTAIKRFGIVRGSWLTVRRLMHCHPRCTATRDALLPWARARQPPA